MTAPQAVPTATERRSAASQSLLPPSLVFADTPSRFVAYLLDGLLIGVLSTVPLSLTGLYDFAYLRFPDRNLFMLGTLLTVIVQAAYFVWFWSGGRRATPGQRVMSIQVGSAFDGDPLTTRQAVVRYLGMGFWLGIPFGLPFRALALGSGALLVVWLLVLGVSVVLSPTRQGLHDRWAGSAVVRPVGADTVWAVRIVWIVVGLAVLEALLLAWLFFGSLRVYYAPMMDFYRRYFDWLWPS